MPLQLADHRYGHVAIFYSNSAKCASSADVAWGPASIAIPAESSLNGIADVWFRLPSVSPIRAMNWCHRTNTTYLGTWEPVAADTAAIHETSLGFGFRVSHFSRYGFIDSDEDDGNDDDNSGGDRGDASTSFKNISTKDVKGIASQTQQTASPVETERPAARHARLRGAGSTPARRRAARPVAEHPELPLTHPLQSPVPPPMVQRPRMSTRTIVDLDDTDPDFDDDDETLQTEDMRDDSPFRDSLSTTIPPLHRTDKLEDVPTTLVDPHNNFKQSNEDEMDYYQSSQRWWTSLGAEPANLHRLREVLFTQPQTDTRSDYDHIPKDDDVFDIPSAVNSDFIDQDEHSYSDSRQFDVVLEECVSREARDFALGDQRDDGLIGTIFPPCPLPYLSLRDSVTTSREGIFTDPMLALGRSSHMCFSADGVVMLPVFQPLRGFSVHVRHAHESVVQLLPSSFRLYLPLTVLCGTATFVNHRILRKRAQQATIWVALWIDGC